MDLNQPHRQSRRSSGHPESGDQPLVPATGKFVEMSMEKLHMIVVAFLGPERSTQNPGAQSFNSACYADYRQQHHTDMTSVENHNCSVSPRPRAHPITSILPLIEQRDRGIRASLRHGG
ncbi:predicted protein [Histoplasma capsulatum H143]|uniref:Uncharacterized protein n=1 Tax=Ajellomyces capsulatus (strain H143) TaxID=544712 RepID=C6H4T0_AJECH|nr:predicted protein [Histoplasma capsulatum H143]